MENGKIRDKQITASSVYGNFWAAKNARLNKNNSAWAALFNEPGEWLQIDLLRVTKVTRVATQGGVKRGWWVLRYKLAYKYKEDRDMHFILYHYRQNPTIAQVKDYVLPKTCTLTGELLGNTYFLSMPKMFSPLKGKNARIMSFSVKTVIHNIC